MNQQDTHTLSDEHATHDMPESMNEMVSIIGISDTMKIVKAYGGTRIFVPKQVKAQHHLANLLGIEQARLLSAHHGGESLTIPRMANTFRNQRNREIVRRYDQGESVRTLAHAYHLTDRQIYTILARPV